MDENHPRAQLSGKFAVMSDRVDMSQYEALLANAMTSCAPETTNLKFPWEQESMRDIFSVCEDETVRVPRLEAPDPLAFPSSSKMPPKKREHHEQAKLLPQPDQLFREAVSGHRNETYLDERKRKYERSYDKWMTLISHNF